MKLIVSLLCTSLAVTQSVLHPDSTSDDFSNKMDHIHDFLHDRFYRDKPVLYTGLDLDRVKRSGRYSEPDKNTLSSESNNKFNLFQLSQSKDADLSVLLPSDDPDSRIKNPYLELSVPAIIARYGYDIEIHVVVSQGYILNVHRIPRAKNGTNVSQKTVLLQHGLFDSSFVWLINGPKKSLGYVLADAGYDVWITNIRGNIHAREHARYKTDSKEFWNYSFHEIAKYDVPAVIDYIKMVKGNDTKIAYIGHSMGTTILFAMLSLRPEYNDVLSTGIAMAPTVYLSHITSPDKNLRNLPLVSIAKSQHSFEMIPREFYQIMSSICQSELGKEICRKLIFYVLGEDEEEISKTVVSRFWSKGNSASLKTLLHLCQMVNTGVFKQFDYEKPEYNMEIYGSRTPPEYELNNIKLNITLFWAKNDLLSNEKDVYILHEKVPSTTLHLMKQQNFNHVGYVWANDAQNLVNYKILEILQKALHSNYND